MLIFIGSGNMEDELKRNFQESRIEFKGIVPDVKDYLVASDYFISASYSEGLPNSVLEALAAGLPLILSDIPSHSEIVGKNYPLLFRPGDPLDLAQKMKILLSDQFSHSLLRNKEQLFQKFDSDRMAGQYQTKYLEQCQLTEI